ncbi:hypothetical protein ABID47_001503 [Paenibacillus favisporus]|uniref:Uncharacterized protein n=1 Tax=Paenibacillus favisporus TaxID=221028 RepID=A0ABV2EZG9_9BACL
MNFKKQESFTSLQCLLQPLPRPILRYVLLIFSFLNLKAWFQNFICLSKRLSVQVLVLSFGQLVPIT